MGIQELSCHFSPCLEHHGASNEFVALPDAAAVMLVTSCHNNNGSKHYFVCLFCVLCLRPLFPTNFPFYADYFTGPFNTAVLPGAPVKSFTICCGLSSAVCLLNPATIDTKKAHCDAKSSSGRGSGVLRCRDNSVVVTKDGLDKKGIGKERRRGMSSAAVAQ